PRERRLELAVALRGILAAAGGTLIVAGTDPLGGDAVHLSATDPVPTGVDHIGRSCHDAGELARASTVDYVTLSPVFATASKPGYGPPLGVAQLGRLAADTPVRVFALGGIERAADAAACRAAGAAGVAVMGAVMRAADPAAAVRE